MRRIMSDLSSGPLFQKRLLKRIEDMSTMRCRRRDGETSITLR